jgi:hypothetical protein
MTEPPSAQPDNAGRTQRGCFAPGHSGNPKGMAKGTRHRATVAAERLMTKSEDTKAITEVIIREARAGQAWACRAWMSVIMPAPRGRLLSFKMPKIEGAQDIPAALLAVVERVAAGQITPTEASEIASIFDCLRNSYETDALTREVEALKARVATLAVEQPNGQRWAA